MRSVALLALSLVASGAFAGGSNYGVAPGTRGTNPTGSVNGVPNPLSPVAD